MLGLKCVLYGTVLITGSIFVLVTFVHEYISTVFG